MGDYEKRLAAQRARTKGVVEKIEEVEKFSNSEELLDHTPLKFGKYKGRTPDYVSDDDPQYLVWAYETVGNFPVCSAALYRACGGTGKRAQPRDNSAEMYEQQQRKLEKEVRNTTRYSFDDMDDDIPF